MFWPAREGIHVYNCFGDVDGDGRSTRVCLTFVGPSSTANLAPSAPALAAAVVCQYQCMALPRFPQSYRETAKMRDELKAGQVRFSNVSGISRPGVLTIIARQHAEFVPLTSRESSRHRLGRFDAVEHPAGGAHHVVAAVEVQDFAGDAGRHVREQKRAALAGFFVRDIAAQRGHRFVQAEHFVDAGAAAGDGLQRAGAERVDAHARGAQVVRQVLHDRIERRLADAHHVVARHRPLAAEIGERQNAGTFAEQWSRGVAPAR